MKYNGEIKQELQHTNRILEELNMTMGMIFREIRALREKFLENETGEFIKMLNDSVKINHELYQQMMEATDKDD